MEGRRGADDECTGDRVFRMAEMESPPSSATDSHGLGGRCISAELEVKN